MSNPNSTKLTMEVPSTQDTLQFKFKEIPSIPEIQAMKLSKKFLSFFPSFCTLAITHKCVL